MKFAISAARGYLAQRRLHMVSPAEGDSRKEVQDLINRINEAWLGGRTGELNEYFHNDMVIRGPDLTELARGRETCVKSYEDFVQKSLVRNFKASEPEVDLWDSLAVATSSWAITYELQGQTYQELGRDLFVLTRAGGRWLVIWRAVLLSPQP
jgi:hypothetical protein